MSKEVAHGCSEHTVLQSKRHTETVWLAACLTPSTTTCFSKMSSSRDMQIQLVHTHWHDARRNRVHVTISPTDSCISQVKSRALQHLHLTHPTIAAQLTTQPCVSRVHQTHTRLGIATRGRRPCHIATSTCRQHDAKLTILRAPTHAQPLHTPPICLHPLPKYPQFIQ